MCSRWSFALSLSRARAPSLSLSLSLAFSLARSLSLFSLALSLSRSLSLLTDIPHFPRLLALSRWLVISLSFSSLSPSPSPLPLPSLALSRARARALSLHLSRSRSRPRPRPRPRSLGAVIMTLLCVFVGGVSANRSPGGNNVLRSSIPSVATYTGRKGGRVIVNANRLLMTKGHWGDRGVCVCV